MAPSDATEKNCNIGAHAQLQSAEHRCTSTTAENIFGKFTSCRTFGAHKLVHFEPFLDYLYEVWHLLSALGSDIGKKFIYVHIYILGHKLPRWNFLQISQLSIRSGAHKRFRRFFYFSQFLTAISRKLWHHLTTEMRTMQCVWKTWPFWIKRCKRRLNRPLYGNATPVRTMSPSNEQRSGLGALQTKNTTFSHLQPARIMRSSPNFAWW